MNSSFEPKTQDQKRRASHDESQSAIAYPSRTIVHAKLEMSNPGDEDEREADSMADSIIHGGKIARAVSTGHSGGGIALPSRLGNQLASLQGHGSQLSGNLKNQMETGFGRDFSNVRIHTDSAAAVLSDSISAKAFTYGSDIYFNRGQFNPETTSGQHLIAHELTHVAQEGSSVRREENPSASPFGLSDEEYEAAMNSSLVKPDEITNSFPTEVGGFSEVSMRNLDRLADKVMSYVSDFAGFAYGFSLSVNGPNKQVSIPDIGPLLKVADKFLLKNNESRLRSRNGDYKIELHNPEVRKFLMQRLSKDHVDLFYLWMKYSPERKRTNSLAQALGLKPLGDGDFVEHKYTMTFLASVSVSGTIIIGGNATTAIYQVNYENNLGMKWSMIVDRNSAGISAGFDFSLDGPVSAKVCAIEDLCASKERVSKQWFSPYDFAHSDVSLGADASLHASLGAEVSSGVSVLTVKMDKGELVFDMSGTSLAISSDVGVGATVGMSGSFGLSNARGLAPTTDPTMITRKKDVKLEPEGYQLINETLLFDTGSDSLSSKKYGEGNAEKLDRVVKTINEAYKVSREAGTLESIRIHLIGNASPLWKGGKKEDREAKNLELSKRRVEAARGAITDMLGLTGESEIAFLTNANFLKTTFDQVRMTDTDITAEGDKAGMEITEGDVKNNDEAFRSVDIDVYLMLKRSREGITPR